MDAMVAMDAHAAHAAQAAQAAQLAARMPPTSARRTPTRLATAHALGGGEGWRQVGELGLALVLSAAIGLLREIPRETAARDAAPEAPMVEVTLQVHGRQSVNDRAAALSELDDVDAVIASDVNAIDE